MSPIEVYRIARKKHDLVWNVFVARPLAAPFVSLLLPTRITPNQVTIFNLLVFVIAAAWLALAPGREGALAGVVVLEASYVFDCVDGMLARVKKLASPTGHLFDFMTDEIKAFFLVGALAIHLWRSGGMGLDGATWPAGDARFLLSGVVGLVVVASGLALTTFVRRPEYTGKATTTEAHYETAGAAPEARSPIRRVAGLALALLRFLNHYPSHVWLFAIFGRLDAFLWMYLVLNLLYLGQTSLAVVLRLGGLAPRAASTPP